MHIKYSNIKTSRSSSVPLHIILISWHQLCNYNIFIFQSCRSVKNYRLSGPTLVPAPWLSIILGHIHFTSSHSQLGILVLGSQSPTKSHYLLYVYLYFSTQNSYFSILTAAGNQYSVENQIDENSTLRKGNLSSVQCT